jgi:hypothetical protein
LLSIFFYLTLKIYLLRIILNQIIFFFNVETPYVKGYTYLPNLSLSYIFLRIDPLELDFKIGSSYPWHFIHFVELGPEKHFYLTLVYSELPSVNIRIYEKLYISSCLGYRFSAGFYEINNSKNEYFGDYEFELHQLYVRTNILISIFKIKTISFEIGYFWNLYNHFSFSKEYAIDQNKLQYPINKKADKYFKGNYIP